MTEHRENYYRSLQIRFAYKASVLTIIFILVLKYNFSACFLEKRKEVPAFGAGFLYCAFVCVCVLNYTAATSIACPERRLQGSQLQFFFPNNLHCTVPSTVKGNTTMFCYHFAGAPIASADSMPMHRMPTHTHACNAYACHRLQSRVILHLPERKTRARSTFKCFL